MEKDLTDYILRTFHPDVIILHGSRANNMARERSDWDVILLYSSDAPCASHRFMFNEANIELFVVPHFSPENPIRDVFGTKLQHARVLHDSNDTGLSLLTRARDEYKAGFTWPDTWPQGAQLWMRSKIDGMMDYQDEPLIFMNHVSRFYLRSLELWYQLLHKRYTQPAYIAIREIADVDPLYHSLLSNFVKSENPTNRIAHAQAIYSYLFEKV